MLALVEMLPRLVLPRLVLPRPPLCALPGAGTATGTATGGRSASGGVAASARLGVLGEVRCVLGRWRVGDAKGDREGDAGSERERARGK